MYFTLCTCIRDTNIYQNLHKKLTFTSYEYNIPYYYVYQAGKKVFLIEFIIKFFNKFVYILNFYTHIINPFCHMKNKINRYEPGGIHCERR